MRPSAIKYFCKTAFFSLLIFALPASAAEDRFPGIEALMTEQEQSDAGIGKLSASEIQALDAWLVRYTANEAPVLQVENEEVREVVRQGVSTRIVGEFEGWTGKTRFYLENGQVWEQRRGGRWKISLQNPEVLITQNLLGSYEMEVVSEGRSIGVRKLR